MKTEITGKTFTTPGTFVVGCNYWASHAGIDMWVDWQPDVVDGDLQKLEDAGLEVLRVFPVWRDFQPIHLLRKGGGLPVEYRHGEEPLPQTEAGRAGVSEQAMSRFSEFLDMAEKHGLKIMVGLVTGFMSGRLYVPPGLEGMDAHTDARALRWELRFVRHFVKSFKHRKSIVAWDLGNECNWMGGAGNADQAYLWTASISNAIRAEDSEKPVVSGMHSLRLDGRWLIEDQAELNDVLTTHPYPYFTPLVGIDPVNTMRGCLHGTAESRFYSDIGGKPVLCEELGQLGPTVSSNAIARDFARTTIFSMWAHDCHGALWWCAHEQTNLEKTPYDWYQLEQELGLLRCDGTPKPTLEFMGEFRKFIDALPFDALPPRVTEAVCILTNDQDDWAAAFGSFALAKQAGYDVVFRHQGQPLEDASLYLLPSVKGNGPLTRRAWLALREKIKAGATLYVSMDGGFLTDLEEVTGVEIQTRARNKPGMRMELDCLPGHPVLDMSGMGCEVDYNVKATRAEVLGTRPDGTPAFTCAKYGKGRVFTCFYPLETMTAQTPGVLCNTEAPPLWKLHQYVAWNVVQDRVVRKSSPALGITEHCMSDNKRVIVLINYSPEACEEKLEVCEGWKVSEMLYGKDPEKTCKEGCVCKVPGNDARVFVVEKT